MKPEIPIRIILERPPAGVDFDLQKGRGKAYETIQKQRSDNNDLNFECRISVKESATAAPDFSGPFVHGPLHERFIYINIGTCAGQVDSVWSRRLKVPLRDISSKTIKSVLSDASLVLATKVPGTGKDGSPNCATVKPFPGWQLMRGL